MNRQQIYNLIARILSLDIHPENAAGISGEFPTKESHWQNFVKLGSDHKILTSVYLALQRHDLTGHLPNDLQEYLQYVLELNAERNENVIRQAGEVRDLLKSEDIDCIFMKGTGNILDGLYSHTGERMLYDLDLLVPEDKMVQAALLMEQEGYHTQKKFIPRALESTMHYPILLREDQVAGVELHRMPVQYLYRKSFHTSRVFSYAMKSKKDKGFLVMSYPDRIIHNFLHAQLMHSGHYHASVSLRDLYDLLLLNQKEDAFNVLMQFGFYRTKSVGYLKLMHKTFGLSMPEALRKSKKGNFFLKRNESLLKKTDRQLKRHFLTIMLLQKYLVLPMRVLWNPQARNYVFSRLADRHWYAMHFRAMKRKIKGS